MFPVDQRTLSYLHNNGDMLFCYFSLGLLLQVPVTVMRYFLVNDLGLGPAELAEVAALVAFPWAIKPVTAYVSENFVSRCVQRRFQIAFAYGLSGIAWLGFLFNSAAGTSGRLFGSLLLSFLSSFFNSFADVCLDAAMVRRVRLDAGLHGNGRLQSFVLASRAFGGLVGSFLSGLFALFSRPFVLIALLHTVGFVAGWKLKSLPVQVNGERVHKSTCDLKKTLTTERIVFVMVLFAIATPVSDFAIVQYFFQTKKSVSPMLFSFSDAVSSIMTIVASLFFNAFLREKQWQSVVMLTQCVMLVILVGNMFLVVGIMNMDSGAYMMMRSAIGSFFGHIGFMPLVVRAAALVPKGLEGTFYSLYMSTLNLGSVVGEELSGLLTRALGMKGATEVIVFYIIVLIHNIFSFVVFHLAYGGG